MGSWSVADIPSQAGRTIVVTGANSGIGRGAARALARAGAHVVLAVRDTDKGAAAAAEIGDSVRVRELNLADLASVRAFAAATDHPVDVLVNNAGLMAVPEQRTADGFEMQFGTNFLGHFALTGLLLPRITDRVVTLSSLSHRTGEIDLADLNWERRRYRPWPAYGQSKLADLMLTYELQRRFDAAGSPRRSVAAHPGYTSTNLQSHTGPVSGRFLSLFTRFVAQGADAGALPTLYAATVTDLPGGTYVGPDGRGELRGGPRVVRSSDASHDPDTARALWDRAAELTGVHPDVTVPTS